MAGRRMRFKEVVLKTETRADDLVLVSHPIQVSHRISTPYHGLPGKATPFD